MKRMPLQHKSTCSGGWEVRLHAVTDSSTSAVAVARSDLTVKADTREICAGSGMTGRVNHIDTGS